ncbi:hypothetical protein D1610_11505 [Sphingomonas gilva]|uniref:Uncharacterized protein n=1 Tax=Sphingomonas gilva TaxID=2305907 RepID=A0A396RLI0_9SPHN|nr:hypothetical protein [Sphingomonas gilva]RHW17168.1 hypothetical protein D1610_11505 [Sphingomonas gilva]
MTAATDTVRRLARHRAEMQRALADNCSLDEARDRIARDRWQAATDSLARRCGTVAAPVRHPNIRLPYKDDDA